MSTDTPMGVTKRLLLVDDCFADLKLLVHLLNQENFKLTVALNGRQAYERALSQPAPDLILMDISMPLLDGYGACALLKENPKTARIPVIFITAHSSLEERLQGFRAGAADYVLKPYEPKDVLARIRVHLPKQAEAWNAPPEETKVNNKDDINLQRNNVLSTTDIHDQAIVTATTRYLSEHLSEAPSQKRLAQLIGVNEKRLTSAFRSLLGKTAHDFLRDERMQLAKTLLGSGTLSVADIADRLGFSSPANFSSAFRRTVGSSPLIFRAQSRLGSKMLHGSQCNGSGSVEKEH